MQIVFKCCDKVGNFICTNAYILGV